MILDFFLPFYPYNSPKNQFLKKCGYIIILPICSKSYHHIINCSWDIVCYGQMDRWADGRTEKMTYWGGCPTYKWCSNKSSMKTDSNIPWYRKGYCCWWFSTDEMLSLLYSNILVKAAQKGLPRELLNKTNLSRWNGWTIVLM